MTIIVFDLALTHVGILACCWFYVIVVCLFFALFSNANNEKTYSVKCLRLYVAGTYVGSGDDIWYRFFFLWWQSCLYLLKRFVVSGFNTLSCVYNVALGFCYLVYFWYGRFRFKRLVWCTNLTYLYDQRIYLLITELPVWSGVAKY